MKRIAIIFLASVAALGQAKPLAEVQTVLPVAVQSIPEAAPIVPDISVMLPNEGTVTSPVLISATSVGCNGKPSVSFGYSIDNGTELFKSDSPTEINSSAALTLGKHIIHFKSWIGGGAPICPVVNSTITVVGPDPYTIPSTAVGVNVTSNQAWKCQHDTGTPGQSSGSTSYPVASPSLEGSSREFKVTYSGNGGERCSVDFTHDTTSDHFAYDTYIYLADPSSVDNIELDINQVLANGKTVIYATQCAGSSGTWEYTINTKWIRSDIPCDPKQWIADTWHHVQIASHRDAVGNVTYDWVKVDGIGTPFVNATGNSAYSLGWKVGDVLPNFQLDGTGAGTMTVYADNLIIWRW